MDHVERALFTKAVTDVVASATGTDLDAALSALGWADALDADARTAVSVLFEAQGRASATSGALDLVLRRALGVGAGTVVLPALGAVAPPGRLDGGSVTVAGLGPAAAASGPLSVVGAAGDELVVVAVDDGALDRQLVGGLDPALGLVALGGSAPAGRSTPLAADRWEGTVAAGQRAVAHELVGASAAMLDLAREHALERIQFGVPIASFQAVRHKLADSLVAVESARGALDAAWEAGSPFDAAVAKAIAGRSARLVAKHAQQVLAGIGFTAEHPLHRYVRRTRVLDALLGDARTLTRALGEQLLEARALPSILPL